METKLRSILCVDDEKNIIAALKRVLRKEGWEIYTAVSGDKGLELLSEHSVDIVISDLRMPKMTGTEFLRKVKKNYPNTHRILLTAYSDFNAAKTSINEAGIYRYLQKPWDDEELKNIIREIFEKIEMKEKLSEYTRKLEENMHEIMEMNQKLQELDCMKDSFLAMITHELKSPLTVILNFSEALKIGLPKSEEEKLYYIDVIQEEGARLNRLIENILDFVRLKSGKMGYYFRTINLNEMLVETIKKFEPQAISRMIHLEYVSTIENPEIVIDKDKIIQVVENLLSNAIKYTPNYGNIVVSTKIVEGNIEIHVEDSGPGVSEEILPFLFADYFIVRNINEHTEGSGLGLSICRYLLTGHKGGIRVENKKGGGALFTVWIPAHGLEEEYSEISLQMAHILG